MKQGKLTNEQLRTRILSHIEQKRGEITVGPAIGEDCAVVRWNDDFVVMTTDPITAAGKGVGALAVEVCCNDLASAGAEPVALLLTLLAPPQATIEDIESVMRDAEAAAENVHADIVGGHTEVTDAVTRIVVSATAIGRVSKSLVSTSGMRSGDAIVMTKWAGLEGTLILARDYHDKLETMVPPSILEEGLRLAGCLSVLPESRVAVRHGATAMHDITEGGVFGAVWEMAHASGCGAHIMLSAIPMLESTRLLCGKIGADPYRMISSGCLLIACRDGKQLCHALDAQNIPCAIIGMATEEKAVVLETPEGIKPIDPPGPDEIYRIKL